MSDKRNIFIAHAFEDEDKLSRLKDMLERAGMEARDSSINKDKPNDAKNEDYIKRDILAPRIKWAGTLVALITPNAAKSEWVNWEIEQAWKQGKHIVGVFAPGATDSDIPEALEKYGSAAIVGWQGDRVVAAINGEIGDWDNPATGEPRDRKYKPERYSCR